MKTLLAVIAFALAVPAQAIPLVSLSPSASNINVGGSVTVDLTISGLDDYTSPSLGAWLAQISYSGTFLGITASDVTFGTRLDLGIFGSFQFVDDSTAGLVAADEISFEDPSDLNLAQPGSFTLASFTFAGIADGVSLLEFDRVELSDENGFSIDYTSRGTSITVGQSVAVPESNSTVVYIALSLGLMLFVRKNHGAQSYI